MPLYGGDTITHDGRAYEIIDGPHYEADWAAASITASLVVKSAPTNL